jgi:hypothetical protein
MSRGSEARKGLLSSIVHSPEKQMELVLLKLTAYTYYSKIRTLYRDAAETQTGNRQALPANAPNS